MKPQTADVAAVIQSALDRYDRGRIEHGQLDLATDNRDFVAEAIEELQDCINYCVFQIIRLQTVNAKLTGRAKPSKIK